MEADLNPRYSLLLGNETTLVFPNGILLHLFAVSLQVEMNAVPPPVSSHASAVGSSVPTSQSNRL